MNDQDLKAGAGHMVTAAGLTGRFQDPTVQALLTMYECLAKGRNSLDAKCSTNSWRGVFLFLRQDLCQRFLRRCSQAKE